MNILILNLSFSISVAMQDPEDIQYAESKLKIMMVLTKGHKCHYFMFIMDHISETMRGDKSLGGIIQSLLL